MFCVKDSVTAMSLCVAMGLTTEVCSRSEGPYLSITNLFVNGFSALGRQDTILSSNLEGVQGLAGSYDLILSAETMYSEASHQPLLDCILQVPPSFLEM